MVKKVKETLGGLSAVNKRKMFMSIVFAAISMSLFTVTASAAGGGGAGALTFVNGMLGILEIVLIAIGGGLGIWGIVNLLEGYGNDNAGAKSQGMKQLMAGAGIAVVGVVGVPLLRAFIAPWFA
jgi:hypothetical protein